MVNLKMDLSKLSREDLIAVVKMERKIIEEVPIGFCITDEIGFFEKVNAHYCKIYGYSQQELLGEHFTMVATEENKESLTKLHDDFIDQGFEMRGEWKVQKKEGTEIFITATAARIKGLDGSYKKVTYVMEITDQKKHAEKLEYLSFYDGLTGLYNRRYFKNEIKRLQSSRKIPIAIIIGDLDGLKSINDNYGHQKGDRYIIAAANILQSTARTEDVAARIGGDEFAIILEKTTKKEAQKICQRIRKKIEEFNQQENLLAPLSISLGFAVMETSNQDLYEVFKQADQKMYFNKERK